MDNDNERICDSCGSDMKVGYCVNGGEEYYCSEKCLNTKYSKEQWEEMWESSGDSYWTEWD